MPLIPRRHHHEEERRPRVIHAGEEVDGEEVDRGAAELERVAASPEPAEEPSEPWALLAAAGAVLERARAYREQFPAGGD